MNSKTNTDKYCILYNTPTKVLDVLFSINEAFRGNKLHTSIFHHVFYNISDPWKNCSLAEDDLEG